MRTLLAGATLGLVVVTVAAGGTPDDGPGRTVYLRYCGACHGPEGKGDGIAGTFMTKKPTDLTTIAARHGGTFPFMKVLQYVDGTEDVRAHGDPDMPVWGQIFREQGPGDATARADARGKLMLVIDHIQRLQGK